MNTRSGLRFSQACVALCAFIGLGAGLQAATLVRYTPDVTDQTAGMIADTDALVADESGGGLSASSLVQNAPDGFANALVWPVYVSAPLSVTEYLSFTVAPDVGQVLTFDQLRYSGLSYFDSQLTLHLRSSLDGYAADIDSETTVGSGGRAYDFAFDLASLATGIGSSVEFRLFPAKTGGADDFMDLRGDTGVGLALEGGAARGHGFTNAAFYSFTLDQVGGFGIPDADRHIRFVSHGATTMRLQNQFSGNARVLCLTGVKDFFDATVFDAAEVNQQFPFCLDIAITDQPSDVIIWKVPDGRLFRLQVLAFTLTEFPPGSGFFEVSGSFQVAPITPILVFRDGFEG